VGESKSRLDQLSPAFANVRTSRDALAEAEVNLVDVCRPDHLHYEVAHAALLAGKNFYCEKPFTANAREAEQLAEQLPNFAGNRLASVNGFPHSALRLAGFRSGDWSKWLNFLVPGAAPDPRSPVSTNVWINTIITMPSPGNRLPVSDSVRHNPCRSVGLNVGLPHG
jgi:hypothetical protein